MTPKEKAAELVKKFEEYAVYDDDNPRLVIFTAKQCALIAVNEIIKALRKTASEIGKGTGYWSDVRKEIEKL